MAIQKGHIGAMNNLAYYYQYIEKNYTEMKKYYHMAIDNGQIMAAYNLGYYYETVEKNYKLMKEYYLMVIKEKNVEGNITDNFKRIQQEYNQN